MKVFLYIFAAFIILLGVILLLIGIITIYKPDASFLGLPLCHPHNIVKSFTYGIFMLLVGVFDVFLINKL